MHPSEKKKIGSAMHGSRFLFLFLTIVLWFVLRGFLGRYVGAILLSAIFSSFILLFCVYSVSQTRKNFHIALGLAIPTFFVSWMGLFLKSFSLPIFGAFLQIIFLGFILLILISHLFRLEEVTTDTILGAACSYFLIGLGWSLIYFILASLSPGSFSFSRPHEEMNLNLFLYYSFMTMTTVGFGDITPLSDPARSLSILEAVLGQFYMAITIAFLVGRYLSRGKRSSASG